MWLPKSWQKIMFYVVDVLGVAVIVFLPIYLAIYGVESLFSQQFGEGLVVEILGALGTAVLLVNIDIFAKNAGVGADAERVQLEKLQQEVTEMRAELAEIKDLIERQNRPRNWFIRWLFWR
ncbi:MAG: hypothetical protein AAFV33_05490 [Chloroflexota bacterium]